MKLIVGLGNPGQNYSKTRHNIGFRVVDTLADRFDQKFSAGKGDYVYSQFNHNGEKVLLLKPLTYMNLSGQAVQNALHFWKLSPIDLLVVVDDLNLPLGKLRCRSKGSAGGQKGLISVINCLASDEFARLRIGIDKPPPNQEWAAFVLQPFTKAEEAIVNVALENACEACLCWLRDGLEIAMREFN